MTTTQRYCPICTEPLDADGICPTCGPSPLTPTRPAHALPAGTVLEDRYLIGRILGQGGFGITYLGRDLTLGMRIAIKEYYPAPYANRNTAASNAIVETDGSALRHLESGKRRFLDEARVLAKFHGSTGIVDVRDFFEANNTAYIVMDYLDGETLKKHLAEHTIDADTTFSLVAPILDSLEKIHAEHVIHRDISPDNIMLLGDGSLCLMDFGAAQVMDFDDQRTVSMVLKSGYAPEEQYRAKGELGPWTDIYALCATMYRTITGVAPDESLQRMICDEMKWPSEMGVSITPAQEAILERGMAPRHEQRYQSIAQMKTDFEKLGADAAATPVPQKTEPRSRRRAAWAGGIAAAIVIVALLGLFLLWPAFSITFEANGGSGIAARSVSRLERIDEPQAPVRTGYTFAGWYLDPQLETPAAFPLSVDEDATLYAAWDRTSATYTVLYRDEATGDNVADPKTVPDAAIGSTAEEAAPVIDGYALASDATASLQITDNDEANTITFLYRKLVGYQVRYVDQSTGLDILDPKSETGITVGTEVVETAPAASGYTLVSAETQSLILDADEDQNQLVFQYEAAPVVPAYSASYYSAPASTGASTASAAPAEDAKAGSANAADDVVWAN